MTSFIFQNIFIFQINLRFKNSLANDPDLMLTVSLANLLIFNDDSLTPWTNVSLVRATNYEYSYYQNNSKYGHAISANKSITQFADTINNMKLNFTFDYAVAIMK